MSERAPLNDVCLSRKSPSVFFGLLLSANDQRRLTTFADACRRRERLTGNPTPGPRFHLSLHALGSYRELPDRIAGAAATAAATVDLPGFAVAFDHTMTFPIKQPTHPFVLCASDGMMALEHLHERLGQALWRVGLGKHVERRFTPHITLLYDLRCAPERPISPLTFRFDSFVLIHSLVDPRRHVHVARWPLRQ